MTNLRRTVKVNGRPRKYNWETWFDGTGRTLIPPFDFAAELGAERFRVQVNSRARRDRLEVETHLVAGGGLHVQAYLPDVELAAFHFAENEREELALGTKWDLLLNGEMHVLSQGDHYRGTSSEHAKVVEAEIARRGLSLKVEFNQNQLAIQPA